MKSENSGINKKLFMWYKVKELAEKGLNKSQISKELSLARKTVRRYSKMDESDFQSWLNRRKSSHKKLDVYHDFVYELLDKYPYLSAAQVEDRLKEHHTKFEKVHSKTVFNYVQYIRDKYGIVKPKSEGCRDYEKQVEPPYGLRAQVDFGEYNMVMGGSKKRQKVHFFAIVLSRSRQKFVVFQDHPFTTSDTITAHEKAFAFYRGVPKEILYDQDRVLMVDEHLGDLLLTAKFQRYCEQQPFTAVFCRKADPETKGKVENVVKYVKQNFLRGREYHSVDDLNTKSIAWLSRTANAKAHGSTCLVPQAEWLKEKQELLTYRPLATTSNNATYYKVRKDNTLAYRSNFYTVPTGTYKGNTTQVAVQVQDDQLVISDIKDAVIARHTLCVFKGKTIRNNNHLRDRSTSIDEKQKEILDHFNHDERLNIYLKSIRTDKPRYYHDHLRLLINLLKTSSTEQILSAVYKCQELNVYNLYEVKQLVIYQQKKQQNTTQATIAPPANPEVSHLMDMQPHTSNIADYESILSNTINQN
ncbi:MAG: IS21 family transposase [Gammaproteobacteria bacterium]|nr:IS21 family transposase [Gammaproteobacteria bacterium]